MNNETKVRTGMNTRARILLAIAVCAAMVLIAFGTSGVFAAGDDATGESRLSLVPEGTSKENLIYEDQGLVVRSTDGETEYSLDGGKTWKDGIPEGYSEEELLTPPSDATRIEANDQFKGPSLSVRTSEAGTEYSVDGGKTWTTEVPEGVTVDVSETADIPEGAISDDSGQAAA